MPTPARSDRSRSTLAVLVKCGSRISRSRTSNRRVTPAEKSSPRFRVQHFEDFYYGWSAAAGDFNHDGVLDVTIGNRYYLGPSFTDSRELYLGQAFNPAKEYGPAMVNYAGDYTGDGWDDILVAESRAPALYVNPRGESRRWTRYTVFPEVVSESITFTDVNNDGKADAVFAGSNKVQWATSDPANPTGPWKSYAVSEAGPWGASIHGIGAGDINGDGKVDLIAPHGWWEQPAGGATVTPWTFHQGAFGRAGNAGGNIEIYDVNGDKLPDVVTALAAHGFGLAWYEQKRDAAGTISFVEHQIMGDFAAKNPGNVTFTELHALTMADVDGDGMKDIITGKRAWAHLDSYSDPDSMGAAVLYWFKTVRDPKAPGGARFVPELIHNRSGVGSMIQVADLNKDGAIDIIAGTNRGGHIFWGIPARGGVREELPRRRPQRPAASEVLPCELFDCRRRSFSPLPCCFLPALAAAHPLDPLTADEIRVATQVARTDARFASAQFASILLDEPAKADVIGVAAGQDAATSGAAGRHDVGERVRSRRRSDRQAPRLGDRAQGCRTAGDDVRVRGGEGRPDPSGIPRSARETRCDRS